MALAVCGALAIVPLLAIVLLPAPKPQPAPAPAAAPARPAPPPAPEPPEDEEPSAGVRHIRGVIRNDNDDPLSGAEVFIQGYSRLRTFSDDAGRYQLRSLPLDELELVVRAKGHRSERLDLEAAEAGANDTHDVQLQAAEGVAGTVLDPEGKPLPAAVVLCREGSDLSTTSDGDGRFELAPEAAGCKAIAQHSDFGDAPAVVLRAGSRNQLRLAAAGSIAGEVVDDDGRGVARYTISVESFRPPAGAGAGARGGGKVGVGKSVNDPAGRFELSGLKPGRYVLTASAKGRPPAHSGSLDLRSAERMGGVRIVLSAGGMLRGQITDADSGEPIARAQVTLDAASMGRANVARTSTDSEGNYLLKGLPRDRFSLRISARGYTSRILTGLTSRVSEPATTDATLSPREAGSGNRTQYSGIGAQLGMNAKGIIIAVVFPGGPAERAGVQSGDVISMIDGEDARDWPMTRAVQLLRGETGTRVSLRLVRDGKRTEVTVERGSVQR